MTPGQTCECGPSHKGRHRRDCTLVRRDPAEANKGRRIQYASLEAHYTDRAGAAPGEPGWVITPLGQPTINIMPGATYARTEDEAMMLMNVYLAVGGDGEKFWYLLRAIQYGLKLIGSKP